MKKLLPSIIVLASVAFNAAAGLKVFSLGTNTVAGSSATNFTSVAAVVGPALSSDLTLAVSSSSPSANTSNVTWMFNVSTDTAVWQTNAFSISYASAGTVPAGVCTNLAPGQLWPFWQLNYVSNANASVLITNLNARILIKTGI